MKNSPKFKHFKFMSKTAYSQCTSSNKTAKSQCEDCDCQKGMFYPGVNGNQQCL